MQIQTAFEEFFCLHSNPSNNNIISAQMPGLKMGVKNDIFWSKIGSGFGEPGGTPPPRIPRIPPPEGGKPYSGCQFFFLS